MTKERPERRRNYFIKKEFQAMFILRFCMLVVLTAMISAIAVYSFSSQSVTTVFENSRLIIKPSTEFIMPGLLLSFLVSVILVGIATIIIVLFISHRIAGPLYKMEASLERIGRGDVGFAIHLRRADEVKRLAETLNITSQQLGKLIGDIKLEAERMNAAVGEVKDACAKLPQKERASIKEAAEKLGHARDRLSEKINKFRLG